MKISKLFHWLYAILMLLPFVFFVPSVLYYAFNDNATMQTVEVPITNTVTVDFNQLVKNGDFSDGFNNWQVDSGCTYEVLDNSVKIGVVANTSRCIQYTTDCAPNNIYLIRFSTYCEDPNGSVAFFSYIGNNLSTFATTGSLGTYRTFSYIFSVGNLYSVPQFQFRLANINDLTSNFFYLKNVNLFNLTQMFGADNEPTLQEFNLMFPSDYYDYILSRHTQVIYNTGETQQLIENTSIVNYAWESIWDLPLFSWTKVTFVSVPFAYITGLFGLAASNSLNYLFGYFATISICWLVFDIIMYVPLLVHRWIDKGIVE